MNPDPAALIACESVLDPILEQLTTVLQKHSANFAGPVAEALERLRSTAADTSVTVGRRPRDARADTTPAPLGSRCTLPRCSNELSDGCRVHPSQLTIGATDDATRDELQAG